MDLHVGYIYNRVIILKNKKTHPSTTHPSRRVELLWFDRRVTFTHIHTRQLVVAFGQKCRQNKKSFLTHRIPVSHDSAYRTFEKLFNTHRRLEPQNLDKRCKNRQKISYIFSSLSFSCDSIACMVLHIITFLEIFQFKYFTKEKKFKLKKKSCHVFFFFSAKYTIVKIWTHMYLYKNEICICVKMTKYLAFSRCVWPLCFFHLYDVFFFRPTIFTSSDKKYRYTALWRLGCYIFIAL